MRYKLRAECLADVFKFLCSYGKNVRNYVIESENLLPDCTITFDCSKRWVEIAYHLNSLEDCHVMVETLRLEEFYTGEREMIDFSLVQ